MTEQSTNGPVNGGVPEQALQDRGAELSAQMARREPPTAATSRDRDRQRRRADRAAGADPRGQAHRDDRGRRLRAVPGTDKPGLFKPGAEKLAILFKSRRAATQRADLGPGRAPDRDLPRDRLRRARRRPRSATGRGSAPPASTSRAYRKRRARLPAVRTAAIIRARQEFGRGLAAAGANGTAAAPSSPDGDSGSSSQTPGEIENPDLPDTWNAVDKMAKKRAYVDAVLSVTGASAIFTQDLGADPTEAAAGGPSTGRWSSGELKQAATQAAIRAVRRGPRAGQDAVGDHPDRARRLHARGRGTSAAARRRERRPV